MATDNQDNLDSAKGKKAGDGMSMKERLLAQRRADDEAPAKASAPPVPAARPASAAAAKPAAAPRATTAKAEEPATKRPVKLAGAKAEERASSRERKQVSDEVRREVEMLKKRQDKWIVYGWAVAGGMLLIAGVVYFIVKGKKQTQVDDRNRYIASIQGFLDQASACDLKTIPGCDKLLLLTDDPANKDKWFKVEILGANDKIATMRSNAKRFKEEKEQEIAMMAGIADLESIANNASAKTTEELAKARRRVTEYEGELGNQLEMATKLAGIRVKIDRAYAQKLYDEAKTIAGKGPGEAKNALVAFTKAEDEITRMLDDAMRGKNKNKEMSDYFSGIFQSLITDSDALVKQVYTPDVIEKTAWLDLMGSEQKDKWQHPGFSGWQLKDGVIQGVGPDLGSKSEAIMSIGDAEQWRDWVLECDVTIVKGDANFYFRVGAAVNNSVTNISMSTTKGNPPFKAGQTYKIQATMLASAFTLNFVDTEMNPVNDEALSWTKRRKGALAISVPPGSEVKISKMRLRVLR